MLRCTRVFAFLASLVSLLPVAATAAADPTFPMDARVTLDAVRATVEARIEGTIRTTRVVAVTEEARSGDWRRVREPLVVMADGLADAAAVWFARPDGSYFTVEKGATGESLRDRAYFPTLLAGRDVIGALVISKSTGKRSLVVASPVMVDGKFAGAVGVSIDAAKLAVGVERAIRFPAEVVFYALDGEGRTVLHRAGDLIFVFPSDVGSPTLADAVGTMLAKPEGVVEYHYAGSDRSAVFERSALTGWVFVLGRSHPAAVKP